MSEWEDLLELFGGDSRQRLQGLENLQAYLDANQLSRHQAAELTDAMCWLLKDNNFKVCQHTLQVLTAFVSQQGSHLKSHANALVPAVVEKLGDMKQAVRITAGQALLGLLSTLGAAVVLERARAAWAHKNWRVRHGMVQSVTEALVQLGAGLLAQRERDELVLQPVVTLLDDSNSHVRDAAVECLEEMYRQLGDHVIDALNQCNIRATQLKEIHTRFQQVAAGHISLRSHALNSPRASETSSVLSASGHSEESDTTPRSCPASPRTLESRGSDRLDKSGSAELSTSGRSNGSTAQHSTRPAGRRGGFKDSGGMTADGELPAVTPILVDSERELKQEIQKLITAMDVKVDWTKRIEAMLRLEALVLGGAGAWDCFFELLKPLRDPITVQLEDRRSAVSRQACHLLGVLAAALGGRFEMHAIYYIPVLFKVLVITVQIMADSADLGMRTLLHHCRSPRLLPRLCDAICTDRSAKLRQSCAEYLLQVVEEWEPSTYERCLDAMENAIRSACQDALSDVRAIGRTAFAAYARIWPERGHAFMRRMDGGLQERLTAAMAVYVPGAYSQQVEAAAAAAQPAVKLPPRRQSSLPSMPNGISSSSQASRPVTPAYPAHAAQSAGTHAAAAAQAPARHDAARPGTGKERRGMRKSIGGAALRIVMHEAQAEEAMDAAAGPAHEMPTAVRRVSSASALLPATAARMRPPTAPARTSELSRPKRVAAVAERASRAGEEEQASTSSRSWPEDETPQATLAAVLAMAHSAGSEWKAKVDVFVALRQLLIDQAPTAAAEIGIHLDRLLVLFLEHIGDAHHKVAAAALEALGEALRCGGRLWEGSLDRLLPPLFLRTFDAKEALRKASLDALAAVPAAIPIEALLPALTKSLEAMRSPKGRLAVMDFFCAYAGAGEFVAHALAGGSSHTLRVWVARVASLLGDKNPDLRKAAAITLEAVHQRLDRTAIPAYMHSAGPTEQLALRRALSPAILDADEHAQVDLQHGRWGSREGRLGMPPRQPTAPPQPPQRQILSSIQQPYAAPEAANQGSAQPHQVSISQPSLRQAQVADTGSAGSGQQQPAPSCETLAVAQPIAVSRLAASLAAQADVNRLSASLSSATLGSDMSSAAAEPDQRSMLSSSPSTDGFTFSQPPATRPALQSHPLGSDGASQQPANALGVAAPQQAPDPTQPAPTQPAGSAQLNHQSQPGAPHPPPASANFTIPAIPLNRLPENHHLGAHPLTFGKLQLRPLADSTATPRPPDSPPAAPPPSQPFADISNVGLVGQVDMQGINTRWGATPAPVRPSPFLVLTPPSASRSKLSFEDSATSEQYLAACIEQLHSAPSYELMRAFTQLVSAVPGDVWQRHIIPAVSGLLSVVATHADDMTCESALLVLRDLALHHGTLWEPLLGLALPQMLEACCQPTREVCMAADEALVAVVAHTPAQRCLQVLETRLPAPGASAIASDGPLVQAAVKHISRAMARLAPQAALAALQPSLLPRLFEAFKHPSADVRKAVVFCLVDIWMALGEALTPLLASLSTSQLKLLTIYVNRAQAKQQQQPNGSMTSAQRSAAPQAVSGC